MPRSDGTRRGYGPTRCARQGPGRDAPCGSRQVAPAAPTDACPGHRRYVPGSWLCAGPRQAPRPTAPTPVAHAQTATCPRTATPRTHTAECVPRTGQSDIARRARPPHATTSQWPRHGPGVRRRCGDSGKVRRKSVRSKNVVTWVSRRWRRVFRRNRSTRCPAKAPPFPSGDVGIILASTNTL